MVFVVMQVAFQDFFTNSSIFNGLLNYLNIVEVYLFGTLETLSEPNRFTAGIFEDFDHFQLELLKAFLTILLLSLFLVFVSWKYYGADIYERFIKSSSSKEIEELKASVSKLKLPKEHTSRV
ncbi:hypothetical protein ABEB36_003300 [Hypothenemus hampei]|uniref:Uncharacterized protein n=1 Tax=Hypothenemus hampei TaxID=57062 RepID=A0ABD1F8R4_HYPHA